MRLISCHIENFGKISDYSFDFSQGVNVLCQENGWGKSTFAAFLRAMFYGFTGERRRTIENERNRYKPWQGGVFGGKIVFEMQGKQYLLTRIFGSKEAEDEFELRDAATNLISHDYSEKIGEEIFKINRDSFMRTLFIGQNDCRTASTDDINAKIGNLTDDTSDMNNYDSAIELLNSSRNRLTPRRITGSISKRKEEIAKYERLVRQGDMISDSIRKQEEILEAHRAKCRETEDSIARLGEQMEKSAAYELVRERVRLYELQEDEKREYELLKEVFAEYLPSLEELLEKQKEAEAYRNLCNVLEAAKLKPEEEEWLAYLSDAFCRDGLTVNEMSGIWQQREVKVNSMPSDQAYLHALEAARQQTNKIGKSGSLIIGGVIAILLGSIVIFLQPAAGMVSLVVGFALAIPGLIIKSRQKSKSNRVNDPELEAIKKTIEENESYIQWAEEQASIFLQNHGREYQEGYVSAMLQEIAGEYIEYCNLEKKAKHAADGDKKEELEVQGRRLEDFVSKFYENLRDEGQWEAGSYVEQIFALREKRNHYEDLRQKQLNYSKARDELSKFEQISSLPALKEKSQELNAVLDETKGRILACNRTLDGLKEAYDQWEEDKEKLRELREIQQLEETKFKNLERAVKLLGQAKEAMTAKYTAPIMNSFHRYYALIVGAESSNFHMDANVNLTVDAYGKQREIENLSSGYQDLVHICLRIALIDAMYEAERPVIILDDPFTNLDDGKMQMAKKLLENISEKYQLIYFTCSEARR